MMSARDEEYSAATIFRKSCSCLKEQVLTSAALRRWCSSLAPVAHLHDLELRNCPGQAIGGVAARSQSLGLQEDASVSLPVAHRLLALMDRAALPTRHAHGQMLEHVSVSVCVLSGPINPKTRINSPPKLHASAPKRGPSCETSL